MHSRYVLLSHSIVEAFHLSHSLRLYQILKNCLKYDRVSSFISFSDLFPSTVSEHPIHKIEGRLTDFVRDFSNQDINERCARHQDFDQQSTIPVELPMTKNHYSTKIKMVYMYTHQRLCLAQKRRILRS